MNRAHNHSTNFSIEHTREGRATWSVVFDTDFDIRKVYLNDKPITTWLRKHPKLIDCIWKYFDTHHDLEYALAAKERNYD